MGRICKGGPADGIEVDPRMGSVWPWGSTDWTGSYAGVIGWYVFDGEGYVWHPGAERPEGS